MAFWPDTRGVGRKQVRRALRRKKANYDNVAALAHMSVALQGLTALEIVLFGRGSDRLEHPGAQRSFHCGVARAIAKNLHDIATSLDEEWQRDTGFFAFDA